MGWKKADLLLDFLLFEIVFTSALNVHGNFVYSLDERFETHKRDVPWLVEFYAPWCGHCKKLEPIYERVAAALDGTNIHVAKIDATMHSDIARKYDVRGYPTILFMKEEKTVTYRGDRTFEDLKRFAVRANSPPLQTLHSFGGLKDRLRDSAPFFLFIGSEPHHLFDLYQEAAINYSISVDFYRSTEEAMKEEIKDINHIPAVLVYKDGRRVQFIPNMENNFHQWISEERFTAVQSAAGSTFYDLLELDKTLILIVADELSKNQQIRENSKRVLEVARSVARQLQLGSSNLRRYQFVLMTDASTVNNIILGKVDPPHAIAFNPTTHIYQFTHKPLLTMDEQDWIQFLTDITTGKAEAHGGRGYFTQLRRALYNLILSVIEIWYDSRLLFVFIIVIPALVIGIVCYTLCCASWGTEEEERDEEEDEDLDNEMRTQENTLPDSNHLKHE